MESINSLYKSVYKYLDSNYIITRLQYRYRNEEESNFIMPYTDLINITNIDEYMYQLMLTNTKTQIGAPLYTYLREINRELQTQPTLFLSLPMSKLSLNTLRKYLPNIDDIYNRIKLKNNEANKDKQNSNQEVSFKAGKPKMSWLEKLGKKLSKFLDKEFVANELEYNGHNFTNTLMAGLSIFGLLTPRGLKAYNRAQVDENGKKDLSEIYEILIRDLSSSLAVVFAVPMLTRAAVTSYEDKSGFVLMQKDRSKSKWASYLDLLNPYSKAHVLKNSEINALYNNINSKDKMLNFCNYINNNGGDLEKIISKSEHVNTVFNENTMKLSELAHLSKKEKNQKILSFFESLGRDGKLDKKSVDSMITKLMKGGSKPNANKILGFARGLNSVPGIITTFLISPYILGWFIPRLTYANTRRMHEKAENERQQKAQNIDKAV